MKDEAHAKVPGDQHEDNAYRAKRARPKSVVTELLPRDGAAHHGRDDHEYRDNLTDSEQTRRLVPAHKIRYQAALGDSEKEQHPEEGADGERNKVGGGEIHRAAHGKASAILVNDRKTGHGWGVESPVENVGAAAQRGESGLLGIWGKPYLCLDTVLDLGPLDDLAEEIALGLTKVPLAYTGGSHRSMGIVPGAFLESAGVDYGEAIARMGDRDFATLASLAEDPALFAKADRTIFDFGEEREFALSHRQMLWLKVRFGVYFPWKAYVEFIPNRSWGEKSSSEGKTFTRIARTVFPKTVAFVESLPFSEIGRCNLMGLESNDHGTVHRDGEPEDQVLPDHFITFCPGAQKKRLFLWNDSNKTKTSVEGRSYWFNDFDYHGVEADPYFRYSIRVDGVFREDFLERLRLLARTE